MKDFITIATFTYPHEVTILKHLLQKEGINFYFENETMLNIVPMYAQALGGIKLKIHPNDSETVKAILKQLEGDNLFKIV